MLQFLHHQIVLQELYIITLFWLSYLGYCAFHTFLSLLHASQELVITHKHTYTVLFRLLANTKQQIQTRDLFITKTAAQPIGSKI